jgi:hypothetical protein
VVTDKGLIWDWSAILHEVSGPYVNLGAWILTKHHRSISESAFNDYLDTLLVLYRGWENDAVQMTLENNAVFKRLKPIHFERIYNMCLMNEFGAKSGYILKLVEVAAQSVGLTFVHNAPSHQMPAHINHPGQPVSAHHHRLILPNFHIG